MPSSKEQHYTENQLLLEKSSIGVYQLPCGYLNPAGELHTEIEVREISGYEEDALASEQIQPWKKLDMLISGCIKRIGKYTDKGSLSAIPLDLPIGDRVFAMMAIRRVSVGDPFPFEEECPKGHLDFYTLDLSDLTVKKMPDPYKRIYDDILPSGKSVRWHIMTGRDEQRVSQLADKFENDKVSLQIGARLELLDEKPVELNDVKALSMKDRNHLRDVFDEMEGGVETNMPLYCRKCRRDFDRELDISKRGFFFPSAALKELKKRYSI